MKYYCENCGMEFSFFPIYECSNCLDFKYSRIPDHETVAHWEERKKRKYPDDAPVYVLLYNGDNSLWLPTDRITAIEFKSSIPFVVATEAGAPPDDWRPE